MKVAVIGRGFGAYAMAPAYRALGWEVELVGSRDTAAVAAACAGSADLISIHSPPFQHREHVLLAVAAGKPVLCDKPFGRNAAEAEAMCDAAQAAGVINLVNFEFRHQPARIKARALIADGAIGQPAHYTMLSFGSGMRGREHGWLNDAALGGGWIGAFASHIIDGIRFLFDTEIVKAGGMTRTEVPSRATADGGQRRSTAEDAFSVWLHCANGMSAAIDSGYAAAVDLPMVVQVTGSAGALTITNESVLTLVRPGMAPEVFDLTPADGNPFPSLPAWLAEVSAAVQEGRQIGPSFADGLATARAIDLLRGAVVRV